MLRTLLQTPVPMLNFLKRLFRKPSAQVALTVPVPVAGASHSRPPEATGGVDVASLSLRAVLEKFPADLRGLVNQMPSEDVKIVLPVAAIMKQLPSGGVKMSFASLVRQAPNGTFRKGNVEDKRMVDVPLSEVFKTINPQALRRREQRQYEVPDTVAGLFDGRAVTAPVAEQPPIAPMVAPSLPVVPPSAPEAIPAPAPIEPPRVLKMPGVSAPAPVAPAPAPVVAEAPKPKVVKPAAPAPTPAGPPEPLKMSGELSLSLAELAAGWPEGIRGELSAMDGSTRVLLPVSEVSVGLQKGKVIFSWEQLSRCLKPLPKSPIAIPGETQLILPLKVVAPAFVAASGAKKRNVGGDVAQALPDFFGPTAGTTPKAAVAAPAPEPVVAPAPIPEPQPAPTLRLAPVEEPAPVVETAPAPEPAPLKIAAPEPVAPPSCARSLISLARTGTTGPRINLSNARARFLA